MNNTKEGLRFAKLVAAYLTNALRRGKLFWGIDQNALFIVYKYLIRTERMPKVKVVDESLFSLEANENSIFWSDGGKEKFELIKRVTNEVVLENRTVV